MTSLCFKSLTTKSRKKIFAKSIYLVKITIKALITTKKTICGLWEGLTLTFRLKRAENTICIIKVLPSCLRDIDVNSFFQISSICLVVEKASTVMYNF